MPEQDSIRVSTLESGLRVVSVPMASVETVTVGIWLHAGARLEDPEDCGVAHFLEHMSFKGTERRSAFALAEEVERVGGHSNASTSREITNYYIKLLADDLPLAVDILADMLLNSRFAGQDVENERGVILQEIAMYEDQPDQVVFDKFQAQAFPNQPMGRAILGTKEIVGRMTPTQLRHYMHKHYSARRCVIAAAGKVDHDALTALAGNHFASFRGFDTPDPSPAVYQGGETRALDDSEQVNSVIGWPSASYRDIPRHYAYVAMAGILGGGMSSRLFQEIREKRGLAYSIFACNEAFQDTGIFCISAGTAPDRTEEAIALAFQILREMQTNMHDHELGKIKAQMKSGLLMAHESTSARASITARELLLHDRVIPTAERIDRIDSLTIDNLTGRIDEMLVHPATVALGGDVEKVTLPKELQG